MEASAPAPAVPGAAPAGRARSYGGGARILSVGIAATGVFTFAYFSVARHVLDGDDYGRITLLWSVLFVTMSVIYRPVEQLLSRTIADRRARGIGHGHPLRVPAIMQGGFALGFLVVALALRGPIQDGMFDGDATLYWILVASALAYAASYFARGYLAGHQWFGLYGGLVLFEALSRFCFPVAVAVGIAHGSTAVALGILAAPLASLCVIPWALRRHEAAASGTTVRERGGLREGAGFAGSVAAIQLAEQTLLNAAVLLVADSTKSGVIFSAMLIARSPLQLFQAIQTSLLPHLAGLEATEGHDAFARAIRRTVAVIAAFAGAVAIGLLAIGPWVMERLLPSDQAGYGRIGLAVLAVGMGLHLAAGTFNQAALARGRAHQAAASWLIAAGMFVAWMLLPIVDDELVRAEAGYAGAAALLCGLLLALYRRPAAR